MNNSFNSIPSEVILYCINYLDEKSLGKFSLTCSELNKIAQDKQLWLSHCFLNPLTSAIIKALDLQEELTSGAINAYVFCQHVLNKNSAALQVLLLSEQPRHFSLWFASYEQSHSPRLFAKPLPTNPHNLFLSKEIGKEKTLNRNKVKDWIMIDVPDDGTILGQLLKQQQVSYSESLTCKIASPSASQ